MNACFKLSMVVHAFEGSTVRQRQADLSDFEISMVYIVPGYPRAM